MKKGDRVVIVFTTETDYFQVGDKATLSKYDGDNWWADFDERKCKYLDSEFCLQRGYTEFKVIEQNT